MAMKPVAAAVALCALAAWPAAGAGLSRLRGRESPDETRLDMEYRGEDSFGKTALTPACSKIECGEYSCPSPFELKTDGTCCGYCWAPDHVVAADRHKVTEYNSTGLAVEQCEGAPSACRGPRAKRRGGARPPRAPRRQGRAAARASEICEIFVTNPSVGMRTRMSVVPSTTVETIVKDARKALGFDQAWIADSDFKLYKKEDESTPIKGVMGDNDLKPWGPDGTELHLIFQPGK